MDFWLFASIIRRWLGLIAVLTIAAAVSAYVVSITMSPAYSSEARVLVGSLTETSTERLRASQQLAQTYAEVAMTNLVLNGVIERLSWTVSPTQLISQIEVRAPDSSSIIRVSATASSPSDAQGLANAMAEEIVQLGVSVDDPSRNLAAIVEPGTAPNEPSSPRVFLNTLIAAAVGLLLGIGLALLLAIRPISPEAGRSPAIDERPAPD